MKQDYEKRLRKKQLKVNNEKKSMEKKVVSTKPIKRHKKNTGQRQTAHGYVFAQLQMPIVPGGAPATGAALPKAETVDVPKASPAVRTKEQHAPVQPLEQRMEHPKTQCTMRRQQQTYTQQ
jgi:hypothetical protein